MSRRGLAALAAVALGFGLAFAVSAPARADYSICPTGQAGLFSDAGGGGEDYCVVFSQHQPVGSCWNVPSYLNDQISSLRVTFGSGHSLTVYQDAGCGGASQNFSYGTYDNLTDVPRLRFFNWNDVISSYRIV